MMSIRKDVSRIVIKRLRETTSIEIFRMAKVPIKEDTVLATFAFNAADLCYLAERLAEDFPGAVSDLDRAMFAPSLEVRDLISSIADRIKRL